MKDPQVNVIVNSVSSSFDQYSLFPLLDYRSNSNTSYDVYYPVCYTAAYFLDDGSVVREGKCWSSFTPTSTHVTRSSAVFVWFQTTDKL